MFFQANMITRNKDTASLCSNASLFTRTYILIWGISILLPLWDGLVIGNGAGGLDNRPLADADVRYLFPTVYATLASLFFFPDYSLVLTCIAHAMDLYIRWDRMPIVWDHEQWAMQIEASFLLHYIPVALQWVVSSEQEETCFVQTARLQFGIFYAAATFWKFNTSFFDPSVSCGTVLILETISTYLPIQLSDDIIVLIGQYAPHLTVLVEGAIAIAILCNHQAITVVLGIVFHLTIFLLPVNAAGGFSMDCASRFLIFFTSADLQSYLDQMRWTHELSIMGASVALLSLIRYAHTGYPFDFGFAAMCILTVYYFQILHFRRSNTLTTVSSSSASSGTRYSTCVTALMMTIALMYGFGTVILGLQHMGAPTMYSNLRYYGGTNHFLAPTSLLNDDIIYGGGIVQIVESTSTAINQRLAYMKSEDIFPPKALHSIRMATNSTEFPIQLYPLCISNPHSRGLLEAEYEASNPSTSVNFRPFYIPISEVKKAFREEADHAGFVVKLVDAGTSDHLQEVQDPSEWVVFSGKYKCEVLTVTRSTPLQTVSDCRNNRAARLIKMDHTTTVHGVLQWLASKLLKPYPQLVGWKEEICMS